MQNQCYRSTKQHPRPQHPNPDTRNQCIHVRQSPEGSAATEGSPEERACHHCGPYCPATCSAHLHGTHKSVRRTGGAAKPAVQSGWLSPFPPPARCCMPSGLGLHCNARDQSLKSAQLQEPGSGRNPEPCSSTAAATVSIYGSLTTEAIPFWKHGFPSSKHRYFCFPNPKRIYLLKERYISYYHGSLRSI